MKVRIGTSGFQYPEWKGKFYPEKMPAARMLAFYATLFATTEINYTFRRIPSESTLEKWSQATSPHFQFSLKAPQSITHWAKLKDCGETTGRFLEVVKTLGDKLGPVLFQLPPNFPRDLPVLKAFLKTLPRGGRSTFEFRHESWFTEEVFQLLTRHRAGLCLAEDDDLATPFVATADFGYLRLRRKEYSARDISKWARLVESKGGQWKDCYIYFKHEENATGPDFAAKMKGYFSE